MKFPYQVIIILFFATCLGALGWSASYYSGKYKAEKIRADTAERSLEQAATTITDMQTRQRDVAALDAKYTKELADAKSTIAVLRADVNAGKRRLRVKATCDPVSETSSAASVDDATGPRLTDTVERDYFTLRERIEAITAQLTGLQTYVREQCLK